MGYCKLMMMFIVITFTFLCSGTFGHRFQRHLKPVSQTPAAAIEIVELNNFNLNNELASDGSIGEDVGGNVTLIGPGEIELELLNGELEFQLCAEKCMGQSVIVCYDAEKINRRAKGECHGSTQCEFRAGVLEEDNEKLMWVKDSILFKKYDDVNTCKSSRMQHPSSQFFDLGFYSCDPMKQNGKIVKLYVSKATKKCPLYVIGAKIWHPPTAPPTPTLELPTEKPAPSKPPPSTSDSSNTLWIVIGVVAGILGIALLIGLGCLIYHCCIKKKSKNAAANADGKKNPISTETKTMTEVQTPTVKQEPEKEKVIEEKEKKKVGVQEKVTTTKEETEEPKPKKKKASKRKSKKQKKSKKEKNAAPPPAPKAPTPNRTKPTQEESPPNATGPAFEETAAASIVSQKPIPPTLRVLDKIITPEPPSATSNQEETDSLSGRHDLNMQMIVENPSQALARFFDNSDPRLPSSNDKKPSEAKMKEIKDFYPVGKKCRVFKQEEVSILSCYRISTMFDKIETMRTTAKKKLEDHGAIFDQNGCITQMPPGTLYYVQNRATAEYVRAFAFGALFYQEIDRYTASQTVLSIPLLFDVILQHRYPVLHRRKACVWIRRQLPIIFEKYSLVEPKRLAYPICAMREACAANRSGFYNSILHTETKDEIEPPPSSYRPKGKLIEYNPKMDKNVIF